MKENDGTTVEEESQPETGNETTESPESKNEESDTSVDSLLERIQKLEEDKSNLNKGIAGYRDKTQALETEIKKLNNKLESMNEDVDDELELSPADQKRLEAWAKKQGLVSKSELEKQTVQQVQSQAISDFLRSNPEWDSDDKWAQINQEFSYYRTPTTYDGYMTLFDKIVKSLSDDTKKAEETGKAKGRAEMKTKSRLSLGGGSQKTGSDESDTVEDLLAKYPNLTKEQIMAKRRELSELYKDRKKKE